MRRTLPVALVFLSTILNGCGQVAADKVASKAIGRPTTRPVCIYEIKFFEAEGGRGFSPTARDPMAPCHPDSVALQIVALRAMFATLEKSGGKVANFKSFELGDATQREWDNRFAECFIRRYHQVGLKGDEFDTTRMVPVLQSCRIFTELEALFREFGAKLTVSEVGYISHLEQNSPEYSTVVRDFVKSHPREARRLPYAASNIWFEIKPI